MHIVSSIAGVGKLKEHCIHCLLSRRLSLKPADEQDRSLSVLTGYLEAVMTSILSSFKDCPSYMRVAFRNLARRVSDHFGDEPGYEVNLGIIIENIGSPHKTGLKRGNTRVIGELQ